MMYKIRHDTKLSYGTGVATARLNIRLKPVEWPGQRLIEHSLDVSPAPVERRDAYGPYVVNMTSLLFRDGVKEVAVNNAMKIEVTPPPIPNTSPTIAETRDAAMVARGLDPLSPAPYLYGSRIAVPEPHIADWAAPLLSPDRPVLEAAQALCTKIHEDFTYDSSATDSHTAPAEAFEDKSGVCQDFAHVMIVALRGHGIPASYISGYLRTLPPPGMDKLVGADAMHAWAAVWCGPDLGWIGLDPTNDCLARESHIVVAMGRDYADVSPIDGVFTGASFQKMSYAVDVAEIEQDTQAG
ncbi:transglutaminase family protein [Croceicoccus gelatinilyticus]|uniref:transglutaminase family protein n=1 Tax=Croceicoccus gelatinilyticus TaxID=2835536 RepID=UPI001BD072A3|nr:transglutaminase family protein [Croceicoccus gelatinilyticus]MBS7668993.1 transglutaminase family protein [Croceicoccus gelatinilyticus]